MFGPLAEGKVKPPRLEDIELAPRLGSIHLHRYHSAQPRSMTAQHIPMANHSPIMSAGLLATTATHRTCLSAYRGGGRDGARLGRGRPGERDPVWRRIECRRRSRATARCGPAQGGAD